MRRRRWLGGAMAAAMLAAASGAHAQAAKPATDEGVICVTVAHLWQGSTDDVVHIATVPVPESFRRMFFGDTCTRFSLVKSTLIDWHLAFGTEATTQQALAFLEINSTQSKPYIANLGARIAATRGNPDFSRLSELAQIGRDYLFLAKVYLRAADFYRSPALLAKAERFGAPTLDAVRAAKARIKGDPAGSTAENASRIEDYDGQADALELGLAVTRAAITRTGKDVAAAEAALKSRDNPFYATAADEAFNHGDDFCDIGDRTDLAAYRTACDDGNFEDMATAWLRYRAQLDILRIDVAGDPAKARELFSLKNLWAILRILPREERAHSEPSGFRRYTAAADAEITLRLARADAFARLAGLGKVSDNDYTIGGLYDGAMDDLMLAESLAPPSVVPGRFRQIATRFLDAHAKSVALTRRRDETIRPGNPVAEREAAYFRTMLPLLKPMAEAR